MRHDVSRILRKHIHELNQILFEYNIKDARSLVDKADHDNVLQKALLMSVGYIGELSKKLDNEVKAAYPNINWRRLATSRNIIFHEYDIVDMGIISTVVFKDIPALGEII